MNDASRTASCAIRAALASLLIVSSAAAQRETVRTRADAASIGQHEVVVNGVRLWYRVAGTATRGTPPVIFLHGGPGYNSHSFSALAGPRLERALRLVYLDQRGSGRSERPWTAHYQIDTMVDDVDAIRRLLGAETIAVIGHSFGGILALEYAARYPHRVARLVLASAPGDMPSTCRLRRERLAREHPQAYARVLADTSPNRQPPTDCELEFRALAGAARETFNNSGMFPDATIQRIQDSVDATSGLRNTGETGRAILDAVMRYRFTKFERLSMPTLVIAGRLDHAVGLGPQQALARALPNATLVEYERAGHFVYLDEPERFARDVTAFLADLPRRTQPIR